MMKKTLLALLICASGPAAFAADDVAMCDDVTRTEGRSEVCQLTNVERARQGGQGLILDIELSKVAQRHAEDMAKRGYFSHVSPDGGTMVTRLGDGGIIYGTAGENIAKGQASPREAMRSWMDSPGHRRNILKSNFKKIGVGVYEKHWVQVFTD